MQAAYVERSTALTAVDFVLQQRAPEVPLKKQLPAKHELKATMEMDGRSVSGRYSAREGFGTIEDNITGSLADRSRVEPPSSFADSFPVWLAPPATSHLLEPKASFNNANGALLGAKEYAGYNAGADPTVMDGSGSSGADVKFWGKDSRMSVDAGTKKANLLKRPVGELAAEESASGEKKKKKKKKKKREKELGIEMCSDQVATGKGGASFGGAAGASVQVGVPPREDSQIEHQKTDNGASSSWLPESPGMPTAIGTGKLSSSFPSYWVICKLSKD